jgi:hypothetical protein
MSEIFNIELLGDIAHRDSATAGVSEFAARVRVIYVCDKGHYFGIPLAADVVPPIAWMCRCGHDASRPGFTIPDDKPARTGRTHYEILRERRTEGFLEKLLTQELRKLRTSETEQSSQAS